MEQPDQQTIDRWHRWFAVECNNRAWELTSAAERSPEEARELLYSAYAAAFHWSKVGQPLNDVRAEMLLAHAHALLGQGDAALAYARRCLAFCQQNECEVWDRAFAHIEMALAAAVAGDPALHAEHYAHAETLGRALKDEEERGMFQEEFSRIPKPPASA